MLLFDGLVFNTLFYIAVYILIVGFGVTITNKHLGHFEAERLAPGQHVIWVFFPITGPFIIIYYVGSIVANGVYFVFLLIKNRRIERRKNIEGDLRKKLKRAEKRIKELEVCGGNY